MSPGAMPTTLTATLGELRRRVVRRTLEKRGHVLTELRIEPGEGSLTVLEKRYHEALAETERLNIWTVRRFMGLLDRLFCPGTRRRP